MTKIRNINYLRNVINLKSLQMKQYACIVAILFSLIACSSTTSSKEKKSEAEKISIVRFDKDFYNYLKTPTFETEELLKIKYPQLLPAFGLTAVGITPERDSANFFSTLHEYFGHPMLNKIYSESLKKYNDVSSFEKELNDANKLISQYFPEYVFPKLAMHVSGFKENVIVVGNLISLSCDKYLGSDYPGYKDFFQPYQLQEMQSKMIVRDYIKAWLISDIRKKNPAKVDFLSATIEEGKTLYILSVLLPDYDANDLIGYNNDQIVWVKENEKEIWKSVVKHNHLYTTDYLTINKYIEEAPYTSTVSPQSPGQVGCWLGWQIVDQYMKKSKKTMMDLVDMDAQTILKESKYNP